MGAPLESAVRFGRRGSRLGSLLLLSVTTGVLAGLAAKILHAGMDLGVHHLIGPVAEPGHSGILRFRWGVLLLPALGGLLSGLVVRLLCRPAPAEGTSHVVDSFHHRAGELGLKDPAIKAALAVAVISLGGSVGLEGVITVLGAAVGARVAGAAGLPPRERRLFLLAGCAAGVGAIFQCPLGGALFATTLLYREPEIEADGLLPSLIASVTSYSTFMAFGGYGRRLLESDSPLVFRNPTELVAYAGLGVLCAGAAGLFFGCLRYVQSFTRSTRIPAWLLPALAGLGVGSLALALPQIMDARYEFINRALGGELQAHRPSRAYWVLFFGLLVLVKCAATGLAIGTRTAGGLFGPVVFIGGAVGAFGGELMNWLLPRFFPDSLREAFIPVGMAGLLAATLRVPLAAIVMVTEMTGSYGLIVPLMLVSVVSYALGRRWGVDAEQLRGPEESPAHAGEAVLDILENAKVKDLAAAEWPHTVRPSTPLAEIVTRFPGGNRPLVTVLDGRRLVGIITTTELSQAAALGDAAPVLVAADLMSPPGPACLHGEDDLYASLEKFRSLRADALPVLAGG
ncbi:MAG TPA: chloride channel protein, partial [Planctomycetota bacterium]|nr:chloride channel protein [Planctomycetota bacterium]